MSGQVVFGDKYFPRPKEEAKVWRHLDRGAHLILLSPRRTGKTSLLRQLERNPQEDYIFLYSMVQSCDTEHEFYQRILEKLHDTDFISNLEKASKLGKDLVITSIRSAINSIEKVSIIGTEVTFKASTEEDILTFQDIIHVIKKLSLTQKLVIVLDEYPDVVEKINKYQGRKAAEQFLTNTRDLCQNIELSEHVQFIFTGSIGLDTLANKLQLSNLINDREKLSLSPLSYQQGIEFINFLTKKNKSPITIPKTSAKHILEKAQWLMPYYIEILWERLEEYCFEHELNNPTISDIDNAYKTLFDPAYRANFNHWAERLKRLDATEQKLAKALLQKLSQNNHMTLNDYININQDSQYQSANIHYVMDCLEHDGYIFEEEEKTYKFTSPILKEWWNRYADRTL